ncbi:MAG: AMP-binding protein [Thiotrichaceae bacterium]|nr:AMP-binding protein [Thiotrichaceae bacterium]
MSNQKRIGIVAANHTGYVEAVLSCIEQGNIAVPLRSIDDEYRINAAKVEQIIEPVQGGMWMQRHFTPHDKDELALIAFTSGTEGNPKGVMLTQRNLANVVQRLNDLMQVDDTIREYIGVPVYHSFGLGRCRAVLAAGGQFFIPHSFNPSEIASMLKDGQINAISSVPSLWRILLEHKDIIGKLGEKVKWIEIGSQYMSGSEKQAMKELFPNACIIQHYGLTEASRTTLLPIHATSGEQLDSVGALLHQDIEVRLTEDGQIAIRGSHIAQAYIIDGQEQNLCDEEGWLITKDLGHITDDYLYYDGRADDVINCGGLKVSPDLLETEIAATLGCNNSFAICRKPDSLRGEGFLIAMLPECPVDAQTLHDTVLHLTQQMGINAANAIHTKTVQTLPRTATGKIQRKVLAKQYIEQYTPAPTEQQNIEISSVQQAFYKTLKSSHITAEDTFISLGGDSLSYVQLSILLERYLGQLPKNWEQLTIQELETLEPKHNQISWMESNVLFRAFAIIGVVVNHAELIKSSYIAGGAMLLLLIAGLNFARFQSESLLQGRWWQPISSLLQNLLIPYLIIAFAFQSYKGGYDLSVFLLYGNFISPHGANAIFPVWFIQVLAQSILLFSLIVFIFRKQAAHTVWQFSLTVLAITIISRLLMPYVWDTAILYNRVPHMMIWLFAIGWAIHFAHHKQQKIILTLIIISIPLSQYGMTAYSWWIILGGLAILWLPYIPVWKPIKVAVQWLSASAYYIFLTHMIFIHILTNILNIHYPILSVATTLAGGIITWLVMQTVLQWIFALRLKSK